MAEYRRMQNLLLTHLDAGFQRCLNCWMHWVVKCDKPFFVLHPGDVSATSFRFLLQYMALQNWKNTPVLFLIVFANDQSSGFHFTTCR